MSVEIPLLLIRGYALLRALPWLEWPWWQCEGTRRRFARPAPPDGRPVVQIQMPAPGSQDTPHWSAAYRVASPC